MAELAGQEVVEVAFTAADGHLNRFESMEGKWSETFKDKHWHINDKVLVRPQYEHLYFKDYLALLHRGGTAAERNSYLHQTELHLHLPQLLNFTADPPYMLPEIFHKETNLWMSAGGTVTSLHVDTSENIMHMVSGQKEFLLFRPNQKRYLHYESVPEIRYDDTGNGPVQPRTAAQPACPALAAAAPSANPALCFGKSAQSARINDIHGLVDPTNVDWARYPNYKNAHGLRCHVRQGDALYVPSHWHHAVYSPPGSASSSCRNVGVNFWYIATKNKQEAAAAHPMSWTADKPEL